MKDEKDGKSAKTAAGEPLRPLVENLTAPELYADCAPFAQVKNGNISITFTSVRYDNSSAPAVAKSVVVGRLVMPIHRARDFAREFYQYMRNQEILMAAKADENKLPS